MQFFKILYKHTDTCTHLLKPLVKELYLKMCHVWVFCDSIVRGDTRNIKYYSFLMLPLMMV
jgi:hypothetical protein